MSYVYESINGARIFGVPKTYITPSQSNVLIIPSSLTRIEEMVDGNSDNFLKDDDEINAYNDFFTKRCYEVAGRLIDKNCYIPEEDKWFYSSGVKTGYVNPGDNSRGSFKWRHKPADNPLRAGYEYDTKFPDGNSIVIYFLNGEEKGSGNLDKNFVFAGTNIDEYKEYYHRRYYESILIWGIKHKYEYLRDEEHKILNEILRGCNNVINVHDYRVHSLIKFDLKK